MYTLSYFGYVMPQSISFIHRFTSVSASMICMYHSSIYFMSSLMARNKEIACGCQLSTSPILLAPVKGVPGNGPPIEPPGTCCMSGCQNCVWILYAEELKNYYGDSSVEIIRKVVDKIEDNSLKSFLKFELGL